MAHARLANGGSPTRRKYLAEKGIVLTPRHKGQRFNHGRLLLAGGAVVTFVAAPLVMLSAASGVASNAVTTPSRVAPPAPTGPAALSSSPRVLTMRQVQLMEARLVLHRQAAAKAAAHARIRAAIALAEAQAARAQALANAHAAAVRQAQEAAAAIAARPATDHHSASHKAATSGSHHRVGLATYYYWHSGQCASPWLPHGTTVTIRNNATGATARCVVTDTQGNIPGHIIDLDPSVFTKLASLSAGVVGVTISW